MNYKSCIEYFQQIEPNMDMTTEHILNLMGELGNPQDQLKVIHIAGTNGKGSTTKMIESSLITAGYQVGAFASPYLISPLEGISFNGVWITEIDYTKAATLVIDGCLKMIDKGLNHPSIYECEVATAVMAFKLKGVDLALIEVGLGGTNDGTNIFTNPLLTIVTSIGLDHTEYLGTTYQSIASHKAGIIKASRPVIIGKMPKEASDTIQFIASELNAPVYNLNNIPTISSSQIRNDKKLIHKRVYHLVQNLNINITLESKKLTYDGPLRLLGPHQIDNALIALLAIDLLNQNGFNIGNSQVKEGFHSLVWPCRCDYFDHEQQTILIDGAHNIDSTNALVKMINDTTNNWDPDKTAILFSALKDKEIEAMLSTLSTVCKTILVTEIDHFRGESKEVIAEIAKKYFHKVIINDTPDKAYETFHQESPSKTLLITGSLYMTIPLYYKYFK